MSEAKANFEYAISDAEQLLECYDQLNGCNSKSQPPEVLKRATLIMTLTAWETYVEDIAKELVDAKYGVVKGSQLGRIVENRLEEHLSILTTQVRKRPKHYLMSSLVLMSPKLGFGIMFQPLMKLEHNSTNG